MNTRNFIKSSLLGVAGLGLSSFSLDSVYTQQQSFPRTGFNYWIWVRPNSQETEAQLKKRYSEWKQVGVIGLLFEDYSEKHFQAAKTVGLQAHRWMWTMNRGEKELLEKHPDWYAVSRSGKSCATHPAYVGYYRFLCPSHPDVPGYLLEKAEEQLAKKDVDGLHLDYIRYPDVVLPVNLWKDYQLDQSSELPDYDFCYSSYSKKAFLEQTGIDIDQVEFPNQSLSWRRFRYGEITKVVNQISQLAAKHHKPLSAAVFPTPEVAKRNVRQDWAQWELDAVFPMIYHGFYREPVSWIGDAVQEGVMALQGKFPLYAGLYMPDFHSPNELEQAISLAKSRGAAGVSIFGESEISTEILDCLKRMKQR